VNFYRNLFGSTFEPLDVMGYELYTGRLLGMDFLFTPNAIAGVEAKQSRHQFDVVVADMESALRRVVESGGTIPGGAEGTWRQKRHHSGSGWEHGQSTPVRAHATGNRSYRRMPQSRNAPARSFQYYRRSHAWQSHRRAEEESR
jgi:hypothetical protein